MNAVYQILTNVYTTENEQKLVDLINIGFDVNGFLNDETPLIVACYNGNSKYLEILLDHGADINLKSPDQTMFPLLASVNSGSIECARILLERGANMQEIFNTHYLYPSPSKVDAIKFLIDYDPENKGICFESLKDKGIDISQKKESSFYSPLMIMAIAGHREYLELLLNAGCDVNEKKQLFVTALALATIYGHLDCMEILIKRGAKQLNMVLIDTAWQAKKEAIAILLKYGADVNYMHENRLFTPLGVACSAGNLEEARFLLENGADPKNKAMIYHLEKNQEEFTASLARIEEAKTILENWEAKHRGN